jgi:N-acetylglucosaminyl-diphospho-decaprenol L-rhamnosyltransferase
MKIQEKPSIAILIVNYKTRGYIINLLQSYLLHEVYHGNVTFYIGDNASWEDLAEIKILFPTLKIQTYQILENRWFWAGNNFLSQYTTEEFLFLINPDILWKESILEKLIQNLIENHAQVIWPKLMTKEWQIQKWDHGELSGKTAGLLRSLGSSYWKEQEDIIQVAWVSGAALMIRNNIFKLIWGFDESFFLYREEEDLCLRIRKKWWKIYYDPSISLTHIGSVVSKASIHSIESQNIYLKKHYPFLHKIGISGILLKFYYRFF